MKQGQHARESKDLWYNEECFFFFFFFKLISYSKCVQHMPNALSLTLKVTYQPYHSETKMPMIEKTTMRAVEIKNDLRLPCF